MMISIPVNAGKPRVPLFAMCGAYWIPIKDAELRTICYVHAKDEKDLDKAEDLAEELVTLINAGIRVIQQREERWHL